MRGSSRSQPVAQTPATPTMMPTEVHTSVMQVSRVCLERDGAIAPAGIQQLARDHEIDERRERGHGKPDSHAFQGTRRDEPLDRRPADGDGRYQDQRALDAAGKYSTLV